jgi:stearoyl-CoA desaturase (Delta-9 desaturase)
MFLYVVRMIALSAGFHRYFSHRTYKTSRVFQFLLACVGTCAVQGGPLWWASHHRWHHKYADTDRDTHSPITKGFWWSHVGWISAPQFRETKSQLIPDLMKYPELRFIDRFYILPPIVLAFSLLTFGFTLNRYLAFNTSAFEMLAWGFFVSTVLLYHGTFIVNSFGHMFGRRRFPTKDESRNNLVIALLTMGEGWHNNHHYCSSSERQGFYWWEVDISHYVLRILSWFGVVWDLREPTTIKKVTDQSYDSM